MRMNEGVMQNFSLKPRYQEILMNVREKKNTRNGEGKTVMRGIILLSKMFLLEIDKITTSTYD